MSYSVNLLQNEVGYWELGSVRGYLHVLYTYKAQTSTYNIRGLTKVEDCCEGTNLVRVGNLYKNRKARERAI